MSWVSLVCLVLAAPSKGDVQPQGLAPPPPLFYVGSAYSVGEDNAALVARAGWPRVEFAYVMGLKDFMDLSLKLDHYYGEEFRIGLRAMLQLVDLDDWLDLGLLFQPMFYARFRGAASAGADITAGMVMGVRPTKFVNIFMEAVHTSRVASKWEYFTNGPGLTIGLEAPVAEGVNILLFGAAKWYWKNLGPEYSGGLGAALWLR